MSVRSPSRSPNPPLEVGGDEAQRGGPQPGELGIVWTLWLTYGAFYFCRQNLSAAVPGMKASVAVGGMGLTTDQIGWILASAKIAYAVGQLLNGQLAERFSPRRNCSHPD